MVIHFNHIKHSLLPKPPVSLVSSATATAPCCWTPETWKILDQDGKKLFIFFTRSRLIPCKKCLKDDEISKGQYLKIKNKQYVRCKGIMIFFCKRTAMQVGDKYIWHWTCCAAYIKSFKTRKDCWWVFDINCKSVNLVYFGRTAVWAFKIILD